MDERWTKVLGAGFGGLVFAIGCTISLKLKASHKKRQDKLNEEADKLISDNGFSIPPDDAVLCPSCGNMTYRYKPQCEWCGALLKSSTAED